MDVLGLLHVTVAVVYTYLFKNQMVSCNIFKQSFKGGFIIGYRK